MPDTPLLDARRARRGFTRAAAGYDAVAVLQREIAGRMLERLGYVKIQPGLIVDLGCGTGASLAALGERYPRAGILGIDVCEAMLRVGHRRRSRPRWLPPFPRGPRHAPLLAADAQALPLRTGVAGLLWSNLMLHWLADPLAGLREMHRTLETDGLLMFSAFGTDTLKELRASFSDGHAHTLRFVDMHDYGDMLIECGFADPVVDAERLSMTYPSPEALFDELRRNGSICAATGYRRGLMGRQTWRAVFDAYEARRVEGRLPASFEVVYGHAWKAEHFRRQGTEGRRQVSLRRVAPGEAGKIERPVSPSSEIGRASGDSVLDV
ncbi:MAG: methyltransferase domain-containing protein [Candidatus Accumulibacter sp.]|jgi:malonyl-CoA O-methyltransferase|nr:methyltransferase domain-containing protein [Accumulibacter sp.]